MPYREQEAQVTQEAGIRPYRIEISEGTCRWNWREALIHILDPPNQTQSKNSDVKMNTNPTKQTKMDQYKLSQSNVSALIPRPSSGIIQDSKNRNACLINPLLDNFFFLWRSLLELNLPYHPVLLGFQPPNFTQVLLQPSSTRSWLKPHPPL